jgi:hypothetical protein
MQFAGVLTPERSVTAPVSDVIQLIARHDLERIAMQEIRAFAG